MSGEPAVPASPAHRRTRQRQAVQAILAELTEFKSAQQIHSDLRRQGDRIGLSTVYRTLQSLVAGGEVDAIRTSEGEIVYRQCSTGHHHHLVCRSCGRTVEVFGPAVEHWATAVAQQHGFRDVSHDLEIFGTCGEC